MGLKKSKEIKLSKLLKEKFINLELKGDNKKDIITELVGLIGRSKKARLDYRRIAMALELKPCSAPESSLIAEKEISLSGKDLIALMGDTLAKGGYFKMKVKGSSMFPFIKEGDMITISPLKNSSVGLGKIVAFVGKNESNLIIHRVVGRSKGSYLIKGDNAFGAKALTPSEDILGCVVKIERDDGRNIRFGLGRERLIIALLSKMNAFYSVFCFWRMLPFTVRKAIKSRLCSAPVTPLFSKNNE